MIYYSYLRNFVYLLNKVKLNLNELNNSIKDEKNKILIHKCNNIFINLYKRINKMIEQDNYSYLVLFEINKELFSLRSYLIEIYNQNINLNINKVIRMSLIDIDLSVSLIEKLQ